MCARALIVKRIVLQDAFQCGLQDDLKHNEPVLKNEVTPIVANVNPMPTMIAILLREDEYLSHQIGG